MQNNNSKSLIDNILYLHQFIEIERALKAGKSDRKENDAEHSFLVAMIAWYVASDFEKEFGVKLNMEKILKMALIHDIVEIEAGDTIPFDAIAVKTKVEREKVALEVVLRNVPEHLTNEFRELIDEMESETSLEAKLVKSADRVSPVFMRVFSKEGWENVPDGHQSEKALDARQLQRHNFSSIMTDLYQQIKEIGKDEGLI
jgi:putative hydrolase of HD superfamily